MTSHHCVYKCLELNCVPAVYTMTLVMIARPWGLYTGRSPGLVKWGGGISASGSCDCAWFGSPPPPPELPNCFLWQLCPLFTHRAAPVDFSNLVVQSFALLL